MTKSQNTKNEQQSTSEQLTEQFNHGLLPDGWYYYKASDGRSNIATEYGLFCIEADNKVKVEVLAEVPTFDEWQASENYTDYLKQCISVYESKDKQATETSIAYNELLEEYQKLKESRAELNSDIADKAYENAMLKSEYEKECKRADELEDSYWKEVEKNKKLKELLKECCDEIEYLRKHYKGRIDHLKNNTRLDKEISQVLRS